MAVVGLPPFFPGSGCPVSLTKHSDPVKGGRAALSQAYFDADRRWEKYLYPVDIQWFLKATYLRIGKAASGLESAPP